MRKDNVMDKNNWKYLPLLRIDSLFICAILHLDPTKYYTKTKDRYTIYFNENPCEWSVLITNSPWKSISYTESDLFSNLVAAQKRLLEKIFNYRL